LCLFGVPSTQLTAFTVLDIHSIDLPAIELVVASGCGFVVQMRNPDSDPQPFGGGFTLKEN